MLMIIALLAVNSASAPPITRPQPVTKPKTAVKHLVVMPARIFAWGRMWDSLGYLLLPDGSREIDNGGYWRLYAGWPTWYYSSPNTAGGITGNGYNRVYDNGENGYAVP